MASRNAHPTTRDFNEALAVVESFGELDDATLVEAYAERVAYALADERERVLKVFRDAARHAREP